MYVFILEFINIILQCSNNILCLHTFIFNRAVYDLKSLFELYPRENNVNIKLAVLTSGGDSQGIKFMMIFLHYEINFNNYKLLAVFTKIYGQSNR